MRSLSFFIGLLLLARTSPATADDFLERFTFTDGSAAFAELRCTKNAIVINGEWQIDPPTESGPFHLHPSPHVRRGGQLMVDFDSPIEPHAVQLDLRTADCRAGKHDIRARLSAVLVRWGGRHDRDEQALIRVWIDRRPLNIIFPIDGERLTLTVDLERNTAHACANRREGQEPNKLCEDSSFDLLPPDAVEFGDASRLLGKDHDVVVTDATDAALCRSFGAFVGSAERPANVVEPTQVEMPEVWQPQAGQAFRLDLDNDGKAEDVVILQVDQYVLHGSILAMFDADTVLTGKTKPPWWADLLELALNPQNYRKSQPEHFRKVVWGGALGLDSDTLIRLYLIGGKTYARVTRALKLGYRPENIDSRPMLRAIAPANGDRYREILVRLQPGLAPEPTCTFTRRSQIFE